MDPPDDTAVLVFSCAAAHLLRDLGKKNGYKIAAAGGVSATAKEEEDGF